MNIRIERISHIDDFKLLPQIQKSAWGFNDLDVEPHHLMTRVQKYGGLVLGAWLDDVLVGFCYAIIGKWQDEYLFYSHMLAVLREHQEKGLGFLLKKAQREEALSMGYRIIRWNFDPLEATNSFFNIHRLGVIANEYEENIYGEGESGLHRGMATDRLIATWILDSERVKKRMESKMPPMRIVPASLRLDDVSSSPTFIEIPRDIRRLKQVSMPEALAWRQRTRQLFLPAFARGLCATEVLFSTDDSRMFFRLERP